MGTHTTTRTIGRALALLALAGAGTAQLAGFQRIGQGEGGFVGPILATDGFGTCATALGDLDGDGLPDLAVGAPGDDDGGPSGVGNGAVWILFLNADGTVKAEQKISATQGGLVGLTLNTAFASSLAALGDVDGDGVVDLAAGAPFDLDGGGFFANGALWILFLNPDGTVKDSQKLSGTQGGLPTPPSFESLGRAVAGLGDLDGDGRVELAAAGGVQFVRLLSLNADGTVFRELLIPQRPGNFGTSLSSPGDLDGDGVRDLVAGAPTDLANQSVPVGSVWILLLDVDGSVKAELELDADSGLLPFTLERDDRFGEAVGLAGDLNADGALDLAVGAPQDDDGGSNRGALYVLHLVPGASGVRVERKISSVRGSLQGLLPNEARFGRMTTTLGGDLDGNGVADVVAGGDGSVWVLFLAPPVFAAASTRNAGTNPATFSAGPGVIGADLHLAVDTLASGHVFALPFGFDTALELPLGGGQVLLALDLGGSGELLGLPGPLVGPLASLDLPVPNFPDLWGFCATLQSIVFGGGQPYALTNAVDLVLGYESAP